jgi:capsular exopolysaccharide synthesis family protein
MTPHSSETTTLHHYLHVIRRRKWIILQAVVLVPLVALVYSFQQQHRYRATAEVWTNSKDLSSIAGNLSGYVDPARVAATNANIARVPAVATAAMAAAGVHGRSAGDFLANSSVNAKVNADILDFKYTDPVAAIAARLATNYAKAFIAYRHELDTSQLKRALAQVRTQIKQLEAIRDTRSALYLTLVQKEQQLQAIEALLTPPVLTRPAEGGTQVQPRPARNAMLGLALGLALGLGLAFLRDALDTRIRSAEEVGERLGLPLLSRLPEPPARLRNQQRLTMLEEPDSVSAEAFRVLRTNLDFVNLERGAQIIMVTSALEGEGKTTTMANLAVALARSGRRVIAVDLDLRRPFLDRVFRVGKRAGLTQVVLGQLPLEEALVPIEINEADGADQANGSGPSRGFLEVLPSGPVPPDVGEFVGGRALGEVFVQLRTFADVILVDAPPLLRVSDAITLTGRVDAVLVVANIATTRRPVLNELSRVLATCPAVRLGFVLTGAKGEAAYGYDYGYYGQEERVEREAAEQVL